MLQLINLFLQQHWQLTFASPAAAGKHKANLIKIGVTELIIELNSNTFDNFILDYQPDMVLFDRFMMEEQFGWRVEKNCPQACRILDTEDLHFLRQIRQQAVKQQREVMPTDFHCETAMREVASILRCDLTLMISNYETKLLTNRFGVSQQQLLNMPFMFDGINPSHAAAQLPSFKQRQHFISIGNFRHAPNWDAVQQLKEHIWPLIRKALPQTEIHIYGAYPPPKASALHNPKQGFLVKGWAENAHEVMRNARICLAPLRFGAGLKGKLSEAMQCGTPSITTEIGAEAMHAGLPWSGLIENDFEKLAQAAIVLYQDESRWLEYQQNGFNIINELYCKDELAQRLLSRLNDLEENLDSERQANFTGAMLRHHSMKSTQYMSQWIEAKNKLASLNQSENKQE